MKSLLILRHAEAVAATPELPDLPRPLTPRGRAQMRGLGRWMQDRRIAPGRIICSTAIRAKETAKILGSAAGWTTQVIANAALYNASGKALLAQVKIAPDELTQLLLVAHAPGVRDLVGLLTAKQADVTLIYEAATLAEVVFDIERWSEIGRGTGALRLLLPP